MAQAMGIPVLMKLMFERIGNRLHTWIYQDITEVDT